jgi:hypothetical protein
MDSNSGPSHFMLDMQEVGLIDRRDLPLFQKGHMYCKAIE